jgi:hypothetical protein
MDASFVNQCLNCAANLKTILSFLEEADGKVMVDRQILDDLCLAYEGSEEYDCDARDNNPFAVACKTVRAMIGPYQEKNDEK